jgi:hypothetical protein
MAVGHKGNKIKAKRIADVQKVLNTLKHPAAAEKYNHIRVQLEDGKEVHLLFTDAEMQKALDRAKKNPEDCPNVSLLRDIFD